MELAKIFQLCTSSFSKPDPFLEVSFTEISDSKLDVCSCVPLFAAPWTAAHQASLSFANSQSLLKLTSIESVMPSSYVILCCPLLLPSSIFPRIRVFSSESVLRIRWPKYWSFSFSISPSNKYSELISFRIGWFGLGYGKKKNKNGMPC